jgi:hypothetical protein
MILRHQQIEGRILSKSAPLIMGVEYREEEVKEGKEGLHY